MTTSSLPPCRPRGQLWLTNSDASFTFLAHPIFILNRCERNAAQCWVQTGRKSRATGVIPLALSNLALFLRHSHLQFSFCLQVIVYRAIQLWCGDCVHAADGGMDTSSPSRCVRTAFYTSTTKGVL